MITGALDAAFVVGEAVALAIEVPLEPDDAEGFVTIFPSMISPLGQT